MAKVINKKKVTIDDLIRWGIKPNEDYEYLIENGFLSIVNGVLQDTDSDERYIDFNLPLKSKTKVWVESDGKKYPGVVVCSSVYGDYLIQSSGYPFCWDMNDGDLISNGGAFLTRQKLRNVGVFFPETIELRGDEK